MNKGQVQEAVVTLYLRLNGYLTSGFIVHSPIHGRNRTEVDIIAVRFPHNAEPVRGVGTDGELGTSNEVVDFVIGEVKSRGQQLRFNEGLRSSRDAVDSILQWCGYFTPAERPAFTDTVLKILEPQEAGPSAGGGAESRLPHANQLWMLVGFALFERLRRDWECLAVFPQATVCALGANAIHKSRLGGVVAQARAVARCTGWPTPPIDKVIKAAVHGPAHDGLDAYLSAWVAALDPPERVPLGQPPNDVIWIPAVGVAVLA